MFKSLSYRITDILVNNGIIEIDDFEIYRYGFETLIYFIVNISVALLIGIIFDRFIHTIVFLSCYCTLRQFTGGYHAKNYTECTLTFAAIYLITIFVANNINDEMKALKLYEQDGIVYIDKGNLTITKDVVGYYNSESNVYYVEGYLHNNSNRSYKSITVSYTIYDAKGNVLGESNAFLSNLEKGKTWNFKSVYDDIDSKDALRFEIREVTYFAGM